jgi:hypothetical protein
VHIQPSKPLPKDLQDFLDSATQGAILVSFGSGKYCAWLVFKGTLAQDFPVSATQEYSRSFFGSGTCSILRDCLLVFTIKTEQHFCTVLTENNPWDDFFYRSIPKDDRGFRHFFFDRNFC